MTLSVHPFEIKAANSSFASEQIEAAESLDEREFEHSLSSFEALLRIPILISFKSPTPVLQLSKLLSNQDIDSEWLNKEASSELASPNSEQIRFDPDKPLALPYPFLIPSSSPTWVETAVINRSIWTRILTSNHNQGRYHHLEPRTSPWWDVCEVYQ